MTESQMAAVFVLSVVAYILIDIRRFSKRGGR